MNVVLLVLSIAIIALAPSCLVYFLLNRRIQKDKHEFVDNMKFIYSQSYGHDKQLKDTKLKFDNIETATRENLTYQQMRRNLMKRFDGNYIPPNQ